MRSQKRGYFPQSRSRSEDEGLDAANIKKITERLLHFVLHSLLLYLYPINTELQTLFPPDCNPIVYLADHVKQDVKSLISLMAWMIKIEDTADVRAFLCLTLDGLFNLLLTTEGRASNLLDVNKFYDDCANSVVGPSLTYATTKIDFYKKRYDQLLQSPWYFDKERLLQEDHYDRFLQYQNYFHSMEIPLFGSFISAYRASKQDRLFPVVALLESVPESDFLNVRLLLPLVKFVNRVMEIYSFKITRKRAEAETLVLQGPSAVGVRARPEPRPVPEHTLEEDNIAGRTNATTFRQPPMNGPGDSLQELYIQCKEKIAKAKTPEGEKLAELFQEQPKKVKDYVISDTGENTPLHIALCTLAQKNNDILKKFLSITNTEATNIQSCPLFALRDDDVVDLRKDSYQSYAHGAALYFNVDRPSGQISYNYESVEANLFLGLLNKKLIDIDRIDTIAYINDDKHSSELLQHFAMKVPQRTPTFASSRLPYSQDLDELGGSPDTRNSEAEELQHLKEKFNVNNTFEGLKEMFSLLNCVMSYALNSKLIRLPELTIWEFSRSVKSLDLFASNSPLKEFRLCYVVYIYEQLEEYAFFHLQTYIKSEFEYIQTDPRHLLLEEYTAVVNKSDYKDQLIEVLHRFMVRTVIFKHEDLDLRAPANAVVFTPSYWPKEKHGALADYRKQMNPAISQAMIYALFEKLTSVSEEEGPPHDQSPDVFPGSPNFPDFDHNFNHAFIGGL